MLFKRAPVEPPEEPTDNVVEEVFIAPKPVVAEPATVEPSQVPLGTVTLSYLGKPLSDIPYRKPFEPK